MWDGDAGVFLSFLDELRTSQLSGSFFFFVATAGCLHRSTESRILYGSLASTLVGNGRHDSKTPF